MNGPAIMPWLRKNESTRWLSRASMVRTLSTPAPRKPLQIACSRRVPMPAWRARGSTSMPNTQPARRRAELPVAHRSPITKPTTSATGDRNEELRPASRFVP